MMKKDVAGTLSPTKNAGGLRRVMLALVVLLLSATLMVGAVSAADEMPSSDDFVELDKAIQEFNKAIQENGVTTLTFTNGEAIISTGGIYQVSGAMNGNISITAPAGTGVTLTTQGGPEYYAAGLEYISDNLNGGNTAEPADPTNYLRGNITISGGADVLLMGMVLYANESNVYDSNSAAVVRVTASNPGTLLMGCSYVDFDETISDKTGHVIVAENTMQAVGVVANLIGNVTGSVLNLQKGYTYSQEIETPTFLVSNLVLMGYENYQSTSTNSALLSIAGEHGTWAKYYVMDNLVLKANNNMNDIHLTYVDSTSKPENIGIWISDNVLLNGDDANDYVNMYSGTVDGHKLGALFVYETTVSRYNIILEPGLNQTGVVWRTSPINDVTITIADNYVSTSTFDINPYTVKGVIINDKSVTPTDITISGKTSIELPASETEVPITATVIADDSYGHNLAWRITSGNDVIKLGSENPTTANYIPLKTGSAVLQVQTNGNVFKDIVITVYNVTNPTVDTQVDVEGETVTISTATGGSSTIEVPASATTTTTTAKIVTESGVTLTLNYDGNADVTKDSTGKVTSVKGAVEEIFAEYQPSPAPSSETNPIAGMKYSLKIFLDPEDVLKDGVQIQLPTIDPSFDSSIETKVKGDGGNPKAKVLAMISASGNLEEINKNIAGNGVELTFTVPLNSINKDKVQAFHIDTDGVTILDSGNVKTKVDGSNLVITIISNGFSSYAIAEDTSTGGSGTPDDTTNTNTGGSSIQGSSTWLQSTPTENPTPTDNPTDTVPTDVPTTQPTQTETKTPGFGVLSILAGLGAVAVLRRK